MRVSSKIIRSTELDALSIRTEALIRGNGKMIEWMVMASYTIPMEKLLTRDIGFKMSLMEMVAFIVK
jgi:hypothetical protein